MGVSSLSKIFEEYDIFSQPSKVADYCGMRKVTLAITRKYISSDDRKACNCEARYL
jgi:hypothetical protein